MRREHDTIAVEVLDHLSRLLQHQGPFHITILAVRANLPHDRLRGYLDELVAMGLVVREPVPMLTPKGRQFLDCYHAWLRIQKLYGLGVRTPRGAQAQAQASPAVRLAGPSPGAAVAAPDPAPASAVVAHDSSMVAPTAEPAVRRG